MQLDELFPAFFHCFVAIVFVERLSTNRPHSVLLKLYNPCKFLAVAVSLSFVARLAQSWQQQLKFGPNIKSTVLILVSRLHDSSLIIYKQMSCCFGVRKQKKDKSEKPMSEVGRKKSQKQLNNDKNQPKLPDNKSQLQEYLKQQAVLEKRDQGAKKADSRLPQGSPKNPISHLQTYQENGFSKDKVKDQVPSKVEWSQFYREELHEKQPQSVIKQQSALKQFLQGELHEKQPQPTIKQQSTLKQMKPIMSSLVIEKQKAEDYGFENNQTNVVDLKAHTKTMQFRFFDKSSIVQTPAVSTFRYDTLLSHYFGHEGQPRVESD